MDNGYGYNKQCFPNRVLVTGGCGFIGSSLVKRLTDNHKISQIRVLDNISTGTEEDLAEVTIYETQSADKIFEDCCGTILIKGDIRNAALIDQCAKGIDCIIHLAANTGVGPSVENPRLDMENNVIGTFNALEAARKNKVSKFIFASSGAPIGAASPPIHEQLAPHPVSPYGSSKLTGEGYCSSYFHTFGIQTISLRFGNVYGPRSKNKSSVIAKFIKNALAGIPCHIYGDGTQTRDFIYIDDLIKAITQSMQMPVGGEIFQIAAGVERTVLEVAKLIQEKLSQHGIDMSISYASPRLGDVKRNFSDTSKAKRVLGWQVDVQLHEGIERTISYFLKKNSTS